MQQPLLQLYAHNYLDNKSTISLSSVVKVGVELLTCCPDANFRYFTIISICLDVKLIVFITVKQLKAFVF